MVFGWFRYSDVLYSDPYCMHNNKKQTQFLIDLYQAFTSQIKHDLLKLLFTFLNYSKPYKIGLFQPRLPLWRL